MPYTLDALVNDCRQALQIEDAKAARQSVCQYVARACRDEDFVATHLSDDNNTARHLLYEDPTLGFCIFAHAYDGANNSRPHDHGPSWAIYGQARGTTEMTDWQVVGDKVRPLKTYSLKPGDVYLYNEGDIHSPRREASTRLIRVEGINMDGVQRNWYELD